VFARRLGIVRKSTCDRKSWTKSGLCARTVESGRQEARKRGKLGLAKAVTDCVTRGIITTRSASLFASISVQGTVGQY